MIKRINKIVEVSLSQLIDLDKEEIMDLLSELVTGSTYKLTEIDYKIVGFETNNIIDLAVSGEISLELLTYDSISNYIIFEEDKLINCNELICGKEVIDEVIKIYNNSDTKQDLLGSNGILDLFLLNNEDVTAEDREIIVENIFEIV